MNQLGRTDTTSSRVAETLGAAAAGCGLYVAVPLLLGTSANLQSGWLNAAFLLHFVVVTLVTVRGSSSLFAPLIRGVCGAWICSAAYLLDWNQPWQRFPIPNLIGFYLGIAAELMVVRPLSSLLRSNLHES